MRILQLNLSGCIKSKNYGYVICNICKKEYNIKYYATIHGWDICIPDNLILMY